jgi:choline dehydrogenase-like flavoprotein
VSDETVDVLIVGAGASGAALAWSLAETRMNILCLEQGDWMDPAKYNLFIVDGSIFVTAAAVNPTNTIQALALHVAETMKQNLGNLFD